MNSARACSKKKDVPQPLTWTPKVCKKHSLLRALGNYLPTFGVWVTVFCCCGRCFLLRVGDTFSFRCGCCVARFLFALGGGGVVVAAGAVRFLCCCGFATVGPTSAEYHPHRP